MIAAKMAGIANGSNQFTRRFEKEGEGTPSPIVSLAQAADLMGVNRDTVSCAKTVLDHGSEVDIAALQKGAGIRPMADKIRASLTPEQRVERDRDRPDRVSAASDKDDLRQ